MNNMTNIDKFLTEFFEEEADMFSDEPKTDYVKGWVDAFHYMQASLYKKMYKENKEANKC